MSFHRLTRVQTFRYSDPALLAVESSQGLPAVKWNFTSEFSSCEQLSKCVCVLWFVAVCVVAVCCGCVFVFVVVFCDCVFVVACLWFSVCNCVCGCVLVIVCDCLQLRL